MYSNFIPFLIGSMVSTKEIELKQMKFQSYTTEQLSCPFVPSSHSVTHDSYLMCCTRLTHICTLATQACILETVCGTVRRLQKILKLPLNVIIIIIIILLLLLSLLLLLLFLLFLSYSKNAIGVKKASKKRPFCSYRQ